MKKLPAGSSGFRGGGVGFGADVLFLRGSTPCRPKGSPLCTILRYPFLVTDPKNFLKAHTYTNFERGAHAKKTQFFGQHFSKSA